MDAISEVRLNLNIPAGSYLIKLDAASGYQWSQTFYQKIISIKKPKAELRWISEALPLEGG